MPIPTNNDAPAMTLFGSAYLGSVRYYAAMLSAGTVAIDAGGRIGRHSWAHNHCRIVGANGAQALAVPVERVRDARNLAMRDLRIAEHGDWRRVHWGAIFSAYGKSPFFEYVEDDLRAVYERGDHWLIDFNMGLHNVVCDFIGLELDCKMVDSRVGGFDAAACADLRDLVGGKSGDSLPWISDVEYYNVWTARHGFFPDLSVLDLLMNNGRESLLILLQMLKGKLN